MSAKFSNESQDGVDNDTLFSRIPREFNLFRQKITHSDIRNIEAACPECHHIQIIDGELFIVERRTAVNFQTRSRTIKAMLKQVTNTFRSIQDLEMFIHLRKWNNDCNGPAYDRWCVINGLKYLPLLVHVSDYSRLIFGFTA